MNRADKLRSEIIHAMPCIACVIADNASVCGPTEMHHLVDKGYRRLSGGHQASIPLGKWHHRGIPRDGYNEREARAIWGPSMKLEGKTFARTYGMQRELLAYFDEQIGKRARESA